MISFKQFLAEKAFNKSVYAQTMKKVQGALVGYEIEAFLPADHKFSSITSPKGEFTEIRRFDTLSEFEDYFQVTRSDLRAITDTYGDWLAEKEDEFVDENWEKHYDDSVEEEEGSKEAEAQARDAARAAFNNVKFGWSEWFSSEYRSAWDFVQEFSLEPKYGWESENGKSSTVFTEEPQTSTGGWDHDTADRVAAELGKVLKTSVLVKSSPGHGDNKTWMIVPDSSIHDGNGDSSAGVGIEIVSPPQAPQKALADLREVFRFMSEMHIETNVSTGIHVNISIPGIQSLDSVKLILFMGDEHVLKVFDRLGNTMTRPHLTAIVRSIQTFGTLPRTAQELIDLAQEALDKDKYRSVNLSKLSDGYLEFRAAGNKDYHERFADVEEITGRWLTAITIACDPKAERNEYLKKFTKLIGRAIPGEVDIRAVPIFDALSKKFPLAKRLKGFTGEGFIRMFAQMADAVSDSYSPSFKQIKEIRELLNEKGVSSSDILKHVADVNDAFSANELTVKKFLKTFKIQ